MLEKCRVKDRSARGWGETVSSYKDEMSDVRNEWSPSGLGDDRKQSTRPPKHGKRTTVIKEEG